MELTKEQKEQLKQRRLLDYRMQMFNLKMTRTAYEAVGDVGKVEECDKELRRLQTAYEAVERMPID